jgi:hypothetical protein
MGELMDDDVVNDRLRCHYQLQLEAEVAFVGAASPTGLLASYDNLAVGKPQARTCLLRLSSYEFGSLRPVPLLQFTYCELFRNKSRLFTNTE